ncbi:molybdenum cofactor guanylyltransferase MobA [Sneathiella sp. P13V-1]|uniref:molybdenum cofactor guanylyltransferase MobA n=1 Tax=Sneathiella sp. P13V-1 TaxID=2697366 RepID=UPI00187B68FE|nr:molybdenum cofactor guanylyltransferase MobA [Sneathiella sp. P13V-1]MBE7638550.1 molybdenum cofactor guanylyltransferase MobA [Sneathiella sp. P13V-1]
MSNLPCVLLAGGQSRRMGGGHKYEVQIGGKRLLDRILDRLEPQVGDIVINANDKVDTDRYPVIKDLNEGFLGPLAGVLSGLRYFEAQGTEASHMLVCPCDIPFVPKTLVKRLRGEGELADDEIVMAYSNERIHPVISLWPFAIADALEQALVIEDLRKIRVFANRYVLKEVHWPEEEGDPFFNVNTKEDLALATARADKED